MYSSNTMFVQQIGHQHHSLDTLETAERRSIISLVTTSWVQLQHRPPDIPWFHEKIVTTWINRLIKTTDQYLCRSGCLSNLSSVAAIIQIWYWTLISYYDDICLENRQLSILRFNYDIPCEARSNVICYYDPALHTLNTNMDTITPDSETGGNTHNKYQLYLIKRSNSK